MPLAWALGTLPRPARGRRTARPGGTPGPGCSRLGPAGLLPEPWIEKLPRGQRRLILIGAAAAGWLPLILLGLALRRLLG